MRKLKTLAMIATLALAACGGGNKTGSNGKPVNPDQLVGTALVDSPTALSAGSTLQLRLLDTTRVDGEPEKIAEASIQITGLPAQFTLDFPRAKIDPVRTYQLDGNVMVDGQVGYVAMARVRALNGGKVLPDLKLVLVKALVRTASDPAGKLKNDFADFEARIGGFKRFTGSRIVGPEGKEIAIGWDAFADKDNVRMVREQVKNPDGSAESYRYAFGEDGKLWVVAHDGSTKTLVGWGADGKVLLREKDGKAVDDKVISEKLIDELTRRAREARSLASAQAGG